MNNKIKEKIVAIVPAAGIGSRMNSSIPKQYIKLGMLTVLEYTLNKLLSFPQIDKIVVVINSNDNWFNTLSVAQHDKITITYGGDNRSDSVLAGLTLLDDSDWALVHDAARPCVSHRDIAKLIEHVLISKQGAILATKVTDTIKKAFDHNLNQIQKTYDRNLLWAAATPQMFNAKALKINLSSALYQGLNITDEASAMEFAGSYPSLIECRRDNIKITRQEDLALAKFYLQEQGCFQE